MGWPWVDTLRGEVERTKQDVKDLLYDETWVKMEQCRSEWVQFWKCQRGAPRTYS